MKPDCMDQEDPLCSIEWIEYGRRPNSWSMSQEATVRRKDMKITQTELDSLQVIADSTEKFLPEAILVKNLIRTLIILRVTQSFNQKYAREKP